MKIKLLSFILFIIIFFGCDKKEQEKEQLNGKSPVNINNELNSKPKKFLAVIEYPLINDKVTVTAILDTTVNYPSFTIVTKKENKVFKTHSESFGEISEIDSIINAMKKNIFWRDGYLFVYSDSPGNGWNARYYNVFTVRNNELLYIGQISEEYKENTNGVNPMYNEGTFKYLYDKFEINDLTSHACAPGFYLIMTETDGHFVVDLKRTWQQGLEEYISNQAEINKLIQNYVAQNDTFKSLNEKLLYNAVLSKYCKKEKECRKAVNLASNFLLKEELKIFNEIVSQVKPGEIPEK